MATTTPAILYFSVEDDLFVRAMTGAQRVLDESIEYIAHEVAEKAADEGGQVSSRLGAPWEISGTGPLERHVTAPEWWAHFVAHGTKDHGPSNADKLVFEIDGETVFTDFVKGIPANPFEERAVESSQAAIGYLVNRLLEGVT